MSARYAACCAIPLIVVAIGLAALFGAARVGGNLGKAWAITYTADVTGSSAYGFTYQDTEGRYPWKGTGLREHTEADAVGERRAEVVIADGKKAKVTVTPAKGAVATCSILLDGRKVLAKGTSPSPGRPAVCESAISP
ncbi:hypothetical protein ACFWCB_31620 [Streptomyces sp. NPDC060048]|uniref:hypothetical protein n=1 Tax=unclassified Streptomyces TaxID=2593676 RepID=UPI0036B89E98